MRYDRAVRARQVRLGIVAEPIERVERGELQRRASSGSPTNMPSTCRRPRHRLRRRRRGVRAEAEHRRAVALLQRRHRRDVGIERRRGASGKTISVGVKPSRSSRAIDLRRSSSRSAVASISRTSQPASRSSDAEQRERVRRLGRAEDLLALLAAALPRERDAVDERRVDEERLSVRALVMSADHRQRNRAAARGRTLARLGAATGTGDSSTLQQRRHTGKMPCSTQPLAHRRRSARRSRSPRATTVVRSPTSTRMNGQK